MQVDLSQKKVHMKINSAPIKVGPDVIIHLNCIIIWHILVHLK